MATRPRNTPYHVQVDSHLTALQNENATMSALTVLPEVDHPHGQRDQRALGQIAKALHRAFGEGRLISYVNGEGGVLREEARGANGSAAVEHPQIYGTPGTPSPDDRYRPVSYEELGERRRNRSCSNGNEEHGDHGRAVEGDEDEAPQTTLTPQELAELVGEDVVGRMSESLKDTCTTADVDWIKATDRIIQWEPTASAPDWIPESVRRRWVTCPAAVEYWKRSLERAGKAERARLTASGVRRRGGIPTDSLPARRLAQLITRDADRWTDIASRVLATYLDSEEIVPQEDVLPIMADPVAFYLDGGSPDSVLLIGLALELDDTELKVIADDVDSKSPPVPVSAEAELRFEADTKAAEAADLRTQLKDTRRELKRVTKEKDQLSEALERLRRVQQAAGSMQSALAQEHALSQSSEARVVDLEAEVETLREDAGRVEELSLQIRALEQIRDQLLAEASSVEKERQLRAQAEAEVQRALKRVHELTQELREMAKQPLPNAEDAVSLVAAVRKPIAAAAASASDRLASGVSDPNDARLLAFAAEFAQLTDSLASRPVAAARVAPAEASAPEPVSPAEEPEVRVPRQEHIPLPHRRRRRIPEFTIRPIGGAGEVGGSALLIQTRRGANVLLDAGQRVKGEYGHDATSQFHYGVTGIERLHAILVSHAHIDHIGSLPLIHRHHSDQQNAPVPVLMSDPTRRLGEIMLSDSAKVQHFREVTLASLAESDFGQGSMEIAYSVADVSACLDTEHVVIADQYRPIPIADTSLVARFLPVSHVLGSCAIHLTDSESRATLLYSGDLGPITEPQVTLPDFGGTQMIEKADVVIMESTYGQLRAEEREGRRRSSDGRERATQILAEIASTTLAGGGHMLLPAFSLGRTQELAMIIQQERGRTMPDGRIFLAGMGEKITEVYDNFDRRSHKWRRPGEFPQRTSVRKWLNGSTSLDDVVAEVLESEPAYIIASPAMVSSGWSRAFLHAMIDDPRHAIVFTGYLPKHAGNIPQLREMHKGANMWLDGQSRRINCSWDKVSLSAHAPSVDLEKFARDLAQGVERTHFGLVHGTPDAQRELAERLTHQLEDAATVRSLRNGEPWVPCGS
jgi:Cft2 family RNA processing exonuclease